MRGTKRNPSTARGQASRAARLLGISERCSESGGWKDAAKIRKEGRAVSIPFPHFARSPATTARRERRRQ